MKANGNYASPFSCGLTLLHIPVSEIYTNSYGGKQNDGYAAITWTSSPTSNDDYIKACPSWTFIDFHNEYFSANEAKNEY